MFPIRPSLPFQGVFRVVLIASCLELAIATSVGLSAGGQLTVDSSLVKHRASIRREEPEKAKTEFFDSGVSLAGLGKVEYEPAFFEKCLGQWQDQCSARFVHDPESDELLCQNHLQRGYLKARMLVPKEHVRAHFNGNEAMNGRKKMIYEGLHLPRFTEQGFHKSSVPSELHAKFQKWFRENRHTATPEEAPVTGKWCNNDYDNDDYVLPWGNTPESKEAVQKMKEHLTAVLEEWTQMELDPDSVVYGARLYHRGSICAMHTDESMDHIVSAIYHLDERDLDKDWSLDVVDHGGHEHSIVSKPGDLIFYESASLPHGRKGTLQGEEFANIFFHFRPKGWKAMREAAYEGMLQYTAKEIYFEPILKPASFLASDNCLPYGTGPEYSGAWNTSVMQVGFTHDGKQATTEEGSLDSPQEELAAVVKRMSYWKGAGQEEETKAFDDPAKETKYMLFDIDEGGLNNMRLGWEIAGLIAFQTGRTLVLPPASAWYLIDTGAGVPSRGSTSSMEDFLNLPQLQRGLSVLSFGEFAAKEFPEFQFLAATKDAWQQFASKHATRVASSCEINDYLVQDRVLYAHDSIDTTGDGNHRLFICANWAEVGQPRLTQAGLPWKTPAAHQNLLRNHFVWHPEVFQLASHVVSSMGLFNYVALHARYNDFQFQEYRETPQAIVDRWLGHFEHWLGDKDIIYISTDSKDPQEFVRAVKKSMKRPLKVMVADDFFVSSTSPIAELLTDMTQSRVHQLKGPIEQVICSFGKVFVGTEKSTFSGYIERMRSYADAPQHMDEKSVESTRLIHTQNPSAELIANVEKQLGRA